MTQSGKGDVVVEWTFSQRKVRSEQKTYDKNSMLMHKSKDIRAKFARSSRECECE